MTGVALLESADRLLLEDGSSSLLEGGTGPQTVAGVASSTITATSMAVGVVSVTRVSMPAGVNATDDYTATTGATLNDCTSTSGWQTSDVVSASTAHGFPTIRGGVFVSNANQHLYVDLPSPVSTTGQTRVVLRVRWDPGSSFLTNALTGWFTVKVADSTGLAGNVVSVPFPATPPEQFEDVVVELGGLSQVRSVGIKSDGGLTGGASAKADFDIAVVRFANETEIDQAAAPPAAVIVAPAHTPAVDQDVPVVDPDRVLVDLRSTSRHVTGLNRVRHLYEWGTPEPDVDQTALLLRAAQGVPDGGTLLFPADETFLVDKTWYLLDKRGVTVDLNGSTLFTRLWRGGDNNITDSIVNFSGCQDVTFRNGHIFGWRPETTNGSLLVNDGGAPTVSETTKQLDAQGEAVALTERWYARHPLAQFPTATRTAIVAAYPTFHLGNVATFTLSDTAQAAGDCVLEVVALDDATVLESRTVTLTATPTVYVLAYEPKNLHRKWKPRVRKATTAANTITVTDATGYGVTGYAGSHDSASAVTANDCQRLTIEDVHVEGAATDAFDFSDEHNDGVTLRRVVSLKSSRQGLSFNWGRGFTVDGFEIGETGRSGIDIEPYAAHWSVRDTSIRHGQIFNVANYGLACGNWGQIYDMHIDDVTVDGAGVGFMIGGGWDSTVTNCRSRGGFAVFIGKRLRVSGLSHVGSLLEFNDDPYPVGVDEWLTPADNVASDVTVISDFTQAARVKTGWTVNALRTFKAEA